MGKLRILTGFFGETFDKDRICRENVRYGPDLSAKSSDRDRVCWGNSGYGQYLSGKLQIWTGLDVNYLAVRYSNLNPLSNSTYISRTGGWERVGVIIGLPPTYRVHVPPSQL